ncbi:uncharacterized protein At4g14450, chloroplastic-like [Cornus florida]|uniref:uncharacterized protein At4g14450, chloroplastic-like n=1 Tax=Cornus florida TaxID=4283 RepID=UPI00289F31A6|nr:uncharacterized protein At4g14450, chloroplastic-like [Cornus florida]
MADTQRRSSGSRRQSSRLQRRAPASIQISPASDWNIAIPLLSPLVTSPSSPKSKDRTMEMRSSTANKEESKKEQINHRVMEPEKPMVFQKWQHPAAPFCYEPAPLLPFICTAGGNRS